MGFGGISIWQLLIILLIVVLIFGTKRLRGMGSDLGGALKSFRSAMKDADEDEKRPKALDDSRPDADFDESQKRTADERERESKPRV
ncbi:MAG: twin-arginine translocase TatA/TatE family subunit [Gammaproteobacteria bacterium]